MVTTPVPPLPNPVQIAETITGRVSAYVKHHERLLIVVLGCVLAWGISGKVQDIVAAHDQKVYASRTDELLSQVQQNQATAAANAKLAGDYAAHLVETLQRNAELAKANAALAQNLANAQETDKHLPPPELAARIENLATLPLGSVTPAPANTFSVTNDGAVGIAQFLEQIPSLQSQLQNAQAETANDAGLLKEQTTRVDGLNTEIAGLHLEITKGDKACKAEVSLVKAQAAKAKRKWFIVGTIVGAIARSFLPSFK